MSETVFKNEIKIVRLQKKIEKLKQQRDHYKEKSEFYDRIIRYYPQFEHDHNRYEDAKIKRMAIRDMEKRLKEQELLIRFFQKDEHYSYSYDIKAAYDEIIREECARLNEQMKKK